MLVAHPAHATLRVIEVAGDDRLCRADHGTSRSQALLSAVRAEVALLRGPRRLIDVERVVGTAVHAALTADALRRVDVDDSVRALVERGHRTDRDAGRVCALITAQDSEVSADGREGPCLCVLDPGPEVPDGDAVLALASDGAGVTADAPRVVYDEAELHEV